MFARSSASFAVTASGRSGPDSTRQRGRHENIESSAPKRVLSRVRFAPLKQPLLIQQRLVKDRGLALHPGNRLPAGFELQKG